MKELTDAGLSVRQIKKYGWRPDTPDMRDHIFAIEPSVSRPASISLRSKMPPVYDQGQLGSCTGNGVGGLVEYERKRQGQKNVKVPSRLFIYYNERVIEGTVNEDAGAEIRDGIKVVHKLGAPNETDWPYDIEKFAEKPPAKAYTDALKHQALSYARVSQSVTSLQSVLATKLAVVFGFTVYESFESEQMAEDGMMPMPESGESILGGHCVVAIGYKPINGQLYFECRNSWGKGWGDDGYFWMPAAYISSPQLASDFWTIKIEE